MGNKEINAKVMVKQIQDMDTREDWILVNVQHEASNEDMAETLKSMLSKPEKWMQRSGKNTEYVGIDMPAPIIVFKIPRELTTTGQDRSVLV